MEPSPRITWVDIIRVMSEVCGEVLPWYMGHSRCWLGCWGRGVSACLRPEGLRSVIWENWWTKINRVYPL